MDRADQSISHIYTVYRPGKVTHYPGVISRMAEESEGNEPITLKVRDQGGEEMFFKVKKNTKLSKVMTAFAERRGVALTSLRFLLDGERVNGEDTPKMVRLLMLQFSLFIPIIIIRWMYAVGTGGRGPNRCPARGNGGEHVNFRPLIIILLVIGINYFYF